MKNKLSANENETPVTYSDSENELIHQNDGNNKNLNLLLERYIDECCNDPDKSVDEVEKIYQDIINQCPEKDLNELLELIETVETFNSFPDVKIMEPVSYIEKKKFKTSG